MFTLRKPSSDVLQALHDRLRGSPFSYPEVGHTRFAPPPGYLVDHNRIQVGTGPLAFARARQAVEAGRMFQLSWLELGWPLTRIAAGELVGLRASLFGLCWTATVCQIVYVIDEPGRFGFAYGTVPGHLMRGEERFLVEMLADGSVWFDILAFSRPARIITWMGYPLVRALQRRFARDAKKTVRRAVAASLRLDNLRRDGSMTPTLVGQPDRQAGGREGGV